VVVIPSILLHVLCEGIDGFLFVLYDTRSIIVFCAMNTLCCGIFRIPITDANKLKGTDMYIEWQDEKRYDTQVVCWGQVFDDNGRWDKWIVARYVDIRGDLHMIERVEGKHSDLMSASESVDDAFARIRRKALRDVLDEIYCNAIPYVDYRKAIVRKRMGAQAFDIGTDGITIRIKENEYFLALAPMFRYMYGMRCLKFRGVVEGVNVQVYEILESDDRFFVVFDGHIACGGEAMTASSARMVIASHPKIKDAQQC
jgi:hypothetical protein